MEPQYNTSPAPLQDRRKPRFDPTINLGHLLTFAGFIVTIGASWSTLDRRVAVLETQQTAQKARDDAQDATLREQLTMIRQSLARIEDAQQRALERGLIPGERRGL